MKTYLATAAIALGLAATPALADCASDLSKINDAMAKVQLDEATSAKAKELMDKATAAQAAKDEATCTTATKELMPLVGVTAG